MPSDTAPSIHRTDDVLAAGLRWRVRRQGSGPTLLLLHGTGASAASWQAVADRLGDRFSVLMPDLPGHGGSQAWADGRATLPRMAEALAALLAELKFEPQIVAGHSAGAALMLQWALHSAPCPAQALMAVNGALQPLRGLPGLVFPVIARLLRHSAWLPSVVARHASQPAAVRRLIAGTGSKLDEAAVAQYQSLLMQPSHVAGALDMMAGWQIDEMLAALPRLQLPLWLVTGTADRTVAPQQSRDWARQLPVAQLRELPGLGHLAHEEAPGRVAGLIDALWRQRAPVGAADTAADTAAKTAAESACGSAT